LARPTAIAVDSRGALYVANDDPYDKSVAIFHPPFDGSSAPSVTITNGVYAATGVALDSCGNLYVSNFGEEVAGYDNVASVRIYEPPLGKGSSPSANITKGLSAAAGLAVDSAGNLYVANGQNVVVYKPPYTDASSPSVTIRNGRNVPAGTVDGSIRVIVR
jgi:sugar lactone lactonase YvrE